MKPKNKIRQGRNNIYIAEIKLFIQCNSDSIHAYEKIKEKTKKKKVPRNLHCIHTNLYHQYTSGIWYLLPSRPKSCIFFNCTPIYNQHTASCVLTVKKNPSQLPLPGARWSQSFPPFCSSFFHLWKQRATS